MAYIKLAVLEILRNLFVISIYCVSALSLHIESTDSMIICKETKQCYNYEQKTQDKTALLLWFLVLLLYNVYIAKAL